MALADGLMVLFIDKPELQWAQAKARHGNSASRLLKSAS
jgi:hypothetical protein